MKYFIRKDVIEQLKQIKVDPCPICGKDVSITVENDVEGDSMAVIKCCICYVSQYLYTVPEDEQAELAKNDLVKRWNERKWY